MARDFTKNVSNYVSLGIGTYSTALHGASKIAIAGWANADTLTTGAADNRLFSMVINAANAAGLFVGVRGETTPKVLRIGMRSVTTDAFQEKSATSSWTTGAWHHWGGVFDIGGDTITPYMDGVAEGGGAVTFGNATYTNPGGQTIPDAIGANTSPPTSTAVCWDGRIAELAIWVDTVPSAADFAAMAKGMSPELFAKAGLLDVFRLEGQYSPETSRYSTRVGTITGTVAKADHPRITRQHRIWVPVTSSAGITGTGALTASDATAAGSGTLAHKGTGSPTVSSVTASGTGKVSHAGSGTLTTSEATLSGSGSVQSGQTGTGALTTSEATASGAGKVTHTGTGALTVSSPTVSGSGTYSGKTATTGGGIGHGGFSRLIIVEVDGEEFRVPESQLKAFLEALRETVEEAPLRITKKRKKEAPKPVEVRIIHVPKEIKPYVALEIDRTTEIINRIVHNAFMEHMQELDDEEALLLLL